MFDSIITNNVGAIVMAGMFLWYINKRDNSVNELLVGFSTQLERLSNVIQSLEKRLKTIESDRTN